MPIAYHGWHFPVEVHVAGRVLARVIRGEHVGVVAELEEVQHGGAGARVVPRLPRAPVRRLRRCRRLVSASPDGPSLAAGRGGAAHRAFRPDPRAAWAPRRSWPRARSFRPPSPTLALGAPLPAGPPLRSPRRERRRHRRCAGGSPHPRRLPPPPRPDRAPAGGAGGLVGGRAWGACRGERFCHA